MASSHQEIQQRMFEYAQKLLRLTLEGQLEWRSTERGTRFQWTAENSGALIEATGNNYPGRNGFELSLLNKNSVEVAELASEWSAMDGVGADRRAAIWNDTLEELYSAAKRIALKVDEVLKVAFSDLPD